MAAGALPHLGAGWPLAPMARDVLAQWCGKRMRLLSCWLADQAGKASLHLELVALLLGLATPSGASATGRLPGLALPCVVAGAGCHGADKHDWEESNCASQVNALDAINRLAPQWRLR